MRPIPLCALLLVLSLSACVSSRSPAPAPSRSAAPAAARPVAATQQLLAQARSRLKLANGLLRSAEDRAELAQLQGLLDEAGRAAARGSDARAQQLADEVLRRADLALDTNYLLLAEVELQKVQTYTGLSDAQLARVHRAELALAARQGRQAYGLLHDLNRELATATKRYVVAAGDSLWVISGKPEVYGNSLLWPLIWQSNLDTLPDPSRLRAGQKLRIKPNPSIEDVVKAVQQARDHESTRVRIGPVRERGRP